VTNREKIVELKKVQSCHEEISNLLVEIIENTFDYHCDRIFNFNIGNDSISVCYEYCCRGEYGRDELHIPIAWLDEGFDYKKAYIEMRRQEDLARIRKIEEEKKRLKELRKAKAKQREEQEYKKYLALKKKYESEVKE
jgi:hypothetical protein